MLAPGNPLDDVVFGFEFEQVPKNQILTLKLAESLWVLADFGCLNLMGAFPDS